MGCIVSITPSNVATPEGSQKSSSTRSSGGTNTLLNILRPQLEKAAEKETAKSTTSSKGNFTSGSSSANSSVRSKSSVNSRGLSKSKHLSQNIIGDKSGRDINAFYDLGSSTILGTGVSGSVKTCVHLKTKIEFAVKTLSKKNLKPDKLIQLRSEINIMTTLDHPNILRLSEFFETENEIYLILDLCKGGELLDRLHEQADHRYSERTACKLIYTMLSTIRYCHAHNIVHRDLKL